jgi:hypothetical protein
MSPGTMLKLYLAAGVLTLVVGLAQYLISSVRNRESEALLKLTQASGTVAPGMVERWVVGPIAALAIVALWPVAVGILIADLCRFLRLAFQRAPGRMGKSGLDVGTDIDLPFEASLSTFRPKSEQLVKRLTRAAIEQRETVIDPLGAAPVRPFGHLHARWQGFVGDIKDGDELWSFEATHVTTFDRIEVRRGYARVHHGRVLDAITVERMREG